MEIVNHSQSEQLISKAVIFGVCLAHRIKDSGLIVRGPGPGVQH